MTIEEILKKLIETKTTVATAESCTGGLIGKTITDYPGASEIYGYGYITYSNEAKIKNLGVNPKTLEEYGAVSSYTAVEMAKGARIAANSDIGVSSTGIAGPGGGTAEKPVGLVYIAISTKDNTEFRKLLLTGTREEVREKTVQNIFMLIEETLF